MKLSVIAMILAILVGSTMLAGCGYKGPPQPPKTAPEN
jgi:predicted small lipoprotein YifL